MVGDINRLFSIINQANLPYQVFEDPTPETPSPAAVEAAQPQVPVVPDAVETAPVREPPTAANDGRAQAYAELFQAYAAPPSVAPPRGTPLAEVFRRMAGR